MPACSYFGRVLSSTTKYKLFPMTMANCTEAEKIPTPPKKRPVRTGPMGSSISSTYSVYSALADTLNVFTLSALVTRSCLAWSLPVHENNQQIYSSVNSSRK